eukprot:9999880-Alexandrium_andersonii.AAC.1
MEGRAVVGARAGCAQHAQAQRGSRALSRALAGEFTCATGLCARARACDACSAGRVRRPVLPAPASGEAARLDFPGDGFAAVL